MAIEFVRFARRCGIAGVGCGRDGRVDEGGEDGQLKKKKKSHKGEKRVQTGAGKKRVS